MTTLDKKLARICVTSKKVDVGELSLDLVSLTAAQHKALFSHLNELDITELGNAISAAFSAGDLLGSEDGMKSFSEVIMKAWKAFTGSMAAGAFDVLIDMAAIALDNKKNFKRLCEGNQAPITGAEAIDLGLSFQVYGGCEELRQWVSHFILPAQALHIVKEAISLNGYVEMGKELLEAVKKAQTEEEEPAPEKQPDLALVEEAGPAPDLG
ncbi:MAG: hypothetical protein GY871_04445 [Actinomycetales bacterium]|nr:hypothetical protein [Actinomycetales bacterium]